MQVSDNMRELSVSEVQMVSGGATMLDLLTSGVQVDASLPIDRKIPLVAAIGRLEDQTGIGAIGEGIVAIDFNENDTHIVLL